MVYFILYIRTLARRNEPHIYVANWYYLSFVVVVAMLHIVNNIALPVSLTGPRSFPVWSGVQDAMIQWWYGHNAVAFFLTSGFLGMLYYFPPVRAGDRSGPTGSRSSASGASRSSTSGSARTICITAPAELGADPRHDLLGHAADPLLGLGRQRDRHAERRLAQGARRCDACGSCSSRRSFYGLSTFEGSFLAIRPVNSCRHYTDWTVGHVHAGTLGWVAMIVFGAIYTLVPHLSGRERMARPAAVEWHFWLAVTGMLIYVVAIWNAGITQGLMWRAYDENGALSYSASSSRSRRWRRITSCARSAGRWSLPGR